jgi:Concanavalin A-like lectin/glucanases superfamily
MRVRRPRAAPWLAAAALFLPACASGQTFAGRVTNYVDPAQQTKLSFGERSHWLQPWRAYMDTVPAVRLKDAVGIQFNIEPQEASSTARLLAANGFRRARLEVGWSSIASDDPTRLADAAPLRTTLTALKTYGIRPLILLNAHHGVPGPRVAWNAVTVEPAARDARRLHLDAASLARVVPGKTGLDSLTGQYKAADVIFTTKDADGWVTLSKPLPRDLPAGSYAASTLKYEPFQRPLLADGTPNPAFEETMQGWLDYVRAVTAEVRSTLGSDAFDVEIWNEQSFGADFLDADTYYDPPLGQTYPAAVHETAGLASYWRLAGTTGAAIDSRASGDGTYTGAIARGQAGALARDRNSAARFDGGYVSVPDSASVDLGDRLSIEAWVKRGANGANHVIAGKGNQSYVLWITGDRLSLRKGSVGNVAQSTTTLTADTKWHHVAATKDGPDVHLYIDGQDVTGAVTDFPFADNSATFQIGASGGGTTFRGLIDEVALYSVPISAATVSAHHDAGRVDPAATRGTADAEILARSVSWLRDPANGVSQVGIGNGFASQRPWDAGSTSPPGLTAIDKHPYPYSGMRRFPPAVVDETRPLDAHGDQDGTQNGLGDWSERFTPAYDSFHPEYYLWATHKVQRYDGFPIQMDHLIRDLSPITTDLNGVAHGRSTQPTGAAPPGMWVTEMNIDPAGAPSSFGLTPSDRLHFQAKATLRTLVSFVNKGVSALDFYAVKDGNFALVSQSFFDALAGGGAYPGDTAGGKVMDSVRRLVGGFNGATSISTPRQLSLLEIGDYAGHKQFEGDGTPDHPPLYNREVLAFLPFQVTSSQFVIPVYVMTTNLAKLYKTDGPSTDPTRYDMPPETYRLTIGNVRGTGAKVSGYDPLKGATVAVKVISRSSNRLVVEMPVTDSPRLLTVRET